MRIHRLRCVVALVILHVTALAVWPAAASDECSGCTILGSLTVGLLSIDPPEPVVGDEVTITYSYAAQLPGGFDCGGSFAGSCTFVGGEPFLTGDEPPTVEDSEIIVRRTVVEAGVATIQLDARAETEQQCRVEDPELGCTFFFDPAFLDASSGPYGLELAAPTPQPDDDGCSIQPAGSGNSHGRGFLVLGLLALARLRPPRPRRGAGIRLARRD